MDQDYKQPTQDACKHPIWEDDGEVTVDAGTMNERRVRKMRCPICGATRLDDESRD